ncbi:MAG TPA: hypothetical protein ENK66_01270 [Arcobacter sp.]|jgi:hypothetical protein|nr:hypothetical protein [Arcobacter sp.]
MSILDLEQQEKVLYQFESQKLFIEDTVNKQMIEKIDDNMDIDYEEWLNIFEEDQVKMEGCR